MFKFFDKSDDFQDERTEVAELMLELDNVLRDQPNGMCISALVALLSIHAMRGSGSPPEDAMKFSKEVGNMLGERFGYIIKDLE